MPGDRTPARRQGRPAVPVGADVPSLSITDVEGEGERALVARGTAYVRAYAAVEQQPTILLKNLAVVLVTLRRCFVDSEGRPDMRGKTGEYREAAGEIYRASGLDADRQSGIQQAVRWHIGNLLRDEMSYDELLAYDLKTSSPLERLQDSREASAAISPADLSRGRGRTDSRHGGTATPLRLMRSSMPQTPT